MRRLFRSRRDRMLAGICGGLGEYLHVDATFIRLVFLILLVFSAFFPMILLYILAYLFIPKGDL